METDDIDEDLPLYWLSGSPAERSEVRKLQQQGYDFHIAGQTVILNNTCNAVFCFKDLDDRRSCYMVTDSRVVRIPSTSIEPPEPRDGRKYRHLDRCDLHADLMNNVTLLFNVFYNIGEMLARRDDDLVNPKHLQVMFRGAKFWVVIYRKDDVDRINFVKLRPGPPVTFKRKHGNPNWEEIPRENSGGLADFSLKPLVSKLHKGSLQVKVNQHVCFKGPCIFGLRRRKFPPTKPKVLQAYKDRKRRERNARHRNNLDADD